jgi:hypothetical protein
VGFTKKLSLYIRRLFAAQAAAQNLRDPIDSGHMIDVTITWCKVNATKKIREFCLMGTIGSE